MPLSNFDTATWHSKCNKTLVLSIFHHYITIYFSVFYLCVHALGTWEDTTAHGVKSKGIFFPTDLFLLGKFKKLLISKWVCWWCSFFYFKKTCFVVVFGAILLLLHSNVALLFWVDGWIPSTFWWKSCFRRRCWLSCSVPCWNNRWIDCLPTFGRRRIGTFCESQSKFPNHCCCLYGISSSFAKAPSGDGC